VPAAEFEQRLPVIALGIKRSAAVGREVLEEFLEPGVGIDIAREPATGFWLLPVATLGFPGRKVEGDFRRVIQDEVGGEVAPGFGDEFVHQIRAMIGEQFCRLLAANGLCAMTLLILNLQGRLSACEFSQT